MKKWEDPVYTQESILRRDIARLKQELEKAQQKYRDFKMSQRDAKKVC